MRRWVSTNESETEAIGRSLAEELEPNGVLLLDGELGSGKTVLTRGVAAALGVESSHVQSPTFTIIREHRASDGRFVHVDLYRLDPGQVEAVGLEEVLALEGVKVVEWAERLEFPVRSSVRLRLSLGSSADCRVIEEIGHP